jgi:hypothetical protein
LLNGVMRCVGRRPLAQGASKLAGDLDKLDDQLGAGMETMYSSVKAEVDGAGAGEGGASAGVGPGGSCSPRHHPQFRPSALD